MEYHVPKGTFDIYIPPKLNNPSNTVGTDSRLIGVDSAFLLNAEMQR